MSALHCPTCGLLHVGPPSLPLHRCHYDELREALDGLVPSAEEDRALRWLAGCDTSTVAALLTLFERARHGSR